MRFSAAYAISSKTGIPMPASTSKQEVVTRIGIHSDDFGIMRETEILFSRLNADARKFVLERLAKIDASAD